MNGTPANVRRITITRGLLRLWMAISMAWIAWCGWLISKQCNWNGQLMCRTGEDDWIHSPSLDDYLIFSTLIFLPPLAILALGAVGRWVVQGFVGTRTA